MKIIENIYVLQLARSQNICFTARVLFNANERVGLSIEL